MAEERLIENQPELPVKEALAIVGIDPEEVTAEEVLAGFKTAFDALIVSNEGDIESEEVAKLVFAKNVVLREIVSSQMEEQRYFEISSPFDNSCTHCKGTGEIYKFQRKTVMVNCHICAAKGELKLKCPSCSGTGRFKKKWKGGGGINVKCRTCGGTGKAIVKCSNCRGKGKVKKPVLDHQIKSTTPCKYCGELGFIIPKKKKPRREHIENPVIPADLASQIKLASTEEDPDILQDPLFPLDTESEQEDVVAETPDDESEA